MSNARSIHSRCAVSTIFFVNGVVIASWVPHVPAVKARHGLTDGDLGLVLPSLAAGAVLALPAAGWMNGRLGSRRMTAMADWTSSGSPAPSGSSAAAAVWLPLAAAC